MGNATYRVHGVMFLVLATSAWLFGMVIVLSHSLLWGSLDLALIVASFSAVIYFYCAKCTARKVCSHILPGYLTRFFPARKTEPYSTADTVIMATAFLAMTGFPLYWLVGSIPVLLVYGGLLAVAVVELRARVCGDCKNIYCVLKKNPANGR